MPMPGRASTPFARSRARPSNNSWRSGSTPTRAFASSSRSVRTRFDGSRSGDRRGAGDAASITAVSSSLLGEVLLPFPGDPNPGSRPGPFEQDRLAELHRDPADGTQLERAQMHGGVPEASAVRDEHAHPVRGSSAGIESTLAVIRAAVRAPASISDSAPGTGRRKSGRLRQPVGSGSRRSSAPSSDSISSKRRFAQLPRPRSMSSTCSSIAKGRSVLAVNASATTVPVSQARRSCETSIVVSSSRS